MAEKQTRSVRNHHLMIPTLNDDPAETRKLADGFYAPGRQRSSRPVRLAEQDSRDDALPKVRQNPFGELARFWLSRRSTLESSSW